MSAPIIHPVVPAPVVVVDVPVMSEPEELVALDWRTAFEFAGGVR